MFGIATLFAAIARLASSMNRMADIFDEASDKLEDKMNGGEEPVNRLPDMETSNGRKRK